MRRIGAIDAGSSYHAFTFAGRYADRIATRLEPEGIAWDRLATLEALLVACRTPPRRLVPHATTLARWVERGGLLVVLGETRPDLWLEDVRFAPCPTDFSWWLRPGADLGIEIVAPSHPLFCRIDRAALTWHVHGHLEGGPGDRPLVVQRDRGCILMERRRGAGRVLITTLDPVYHHGSFFMPATTRFLDGLFAWLVEGAPSEAVVVNDSSRATERAAERLV